MAKQPEAALTNGRIDNRPSPTYTDDCVSLGIPHVMYRTRCPVQNQVPCVARARPQVAHLATLRSSVPFVHFFDGFRTSHEISKVSVIRGSDVRRLLSQSVYQEAVRRHQQQALNPTHPQQRGQAQVGRSTGRR